MVQIWIALMSHRKHKKNLQLAERKIYIYLTIRILPDFL